MPIVKKPEFIISLLNTAVEQRNRVKESNYTLLEKPPEFWMDFNNIKSVRDIEDVNEDHIKKYRYENLSTFRRIQYWGIAISIVCEKIDNSWVFRYARSILWPLAIYVMSYSVARDRLDSSIPSDRMVLVLDNIICCTLLAEGVLRLSGLYLRLCIEQAYHRKIKWMLSLIDSGIMDAVVASLCLFYGISKRGLWLRLLRNIVLTRVFFDIFPHLNVFLECLTIGFKNISNVMIIFTAVIVIYGHIGYYLFRINDPFHFGNVLLSCLQFFCITTLENWSTLIYVNVYGCNGYFSEYQYVPPAGINASVPVQTQFGKFQLPLCDNPTPRPYAAGFVLLSYVLINAYLVRELLLSIVALGVDSKLGELKYFSLFGDEITDVRYLPPEQQASKNKIISTDELAKQHHFISKHLRTVWDIQREVQVSAITDIQSPKSGNKLGRADSGIDDDMNTYIVKKCSDIESSKSFTLVFGTALIADAVIVFIENYIYGESEVTIALHLLLQIFFTIQLIMKVVGSMTEITTYKSLKKLVLDYPASLLDLCGVVVFFLPLAQPNSPDFEALKIFRILRAGRFVILYGRFNAAFHSILESFSVSYIPLTYVIMFITVVYLQYSIAGALLFREVNPFYFKTVSRAMFTLLQLMSMDNWSDIMRKCIFGCYLFGYETGVSKYDNSCHSTKVGQGWWAPIYFVSFLIITANILMSLFTGLLISSVQLIRQAKNSEEEMEIRVNITLSRLNLDNSLKPSFEKLFNYLDVREEANLILEDLRPVIEVINVSSNDIFDIFQYVDLDKSGQLDFAEFCEFLAIVGKKCKNKGENIFRDFKVLLAENQERKMNTHASASALFIRRGLSKIHAFSTNGADGIVQKFVEESKDQNSQEINHLIKEEHLPSLPISYVSRGISQNNGSLAQLGQYPSQTKLQKQLSKHKKKSNAFSKAAAHIIALGYASDAKRLSLGDIENQIIHHNDDIKQIQSVDEEPGGEIPTISQKQLQDETEQYTPLSNNTNQVHPSRLFEYTPKHYIENLQEPIPENNASDAVNSLQRNDTIPFTKLDSQSPKDMSIDVSNTHMPNAQNSIYHPISSSSRRYSMTVSIPPNTHFDVIQPTTNQSKIIDALSDLEDIESDKNDRYHGPIMQPNSMQSPISKITARTIEVYSPQESSAKYRRSPTSTGYYSLFNTFSPTMSPAKMRDIAEWKSHNA